MNATSCLGIVLVNVLGLASVFAEDSQTRPTSDDDRLRSWLENMVWHHRYTTDEIVQVTGLNEQDAQNKLRDFGISDSTRPDRQKDRLLVLPYPGGRHPRIGFLEGAVDPQRETKLSVFASWDDHSYAVLDVPEAIWSNLGLTYLAHTHVETVWSRQGITLPQHEWQIDDTGTYTIQRTLPNGITFGTQAVPMKDHVAMEMWLTNGTDQTLTDLRVQNCVMLKGLDGFQRQTNDNKQFIDGYAIARSDDGSRYIITAWDPLHRGWGNQKCPCLHSDPKFPDCEPGETKRLRGWFSFYQGDDIDAEIRRIEATLWPTHSLSDGKFLIRGQILDATTKESLPSRLYVQNIDSGEWYFAESDAEAGASAVYDKSRGQSGSIEKHTNLSAHPFRLWLPAGRYRAEAVRGKEYVPVTEEFRVGGENVSVILELQRFSDWPKRGWYSGDTHVHRTMDELPVAMLAEDLNVALPLNHWVRDSREIPAESGPALEPKPLYVDDTHVIYPINTEYEIFSINGSRHPQGAVFVLNHRHPLTLKAPPVRPIAVEARNQGAILDLDKHSWNWSMMIVPIMNVDLFELSNNHHWRTEFGFSKWTIENAPPDWPEIETDDDGFTELGWTKFGMQTYYALLNCGFRMRVSAGTASGVHPVPLGHSRVYVHTGDSFTYENWIRHLNGGHSFITNGPLLDVRFNNELPGTTFKAFQSGQSIRITGTIEGTQPLKSVEIVQNGVVVRSIDPQPKETAVGSLRFEIDEQVQPKGSGWIAVRCFEKRSDDRVRFAHTNPIFVEIPTRPLVPRRRDAEYFARRMDGEIARNRGVLTPAALAEYQQARDIYEAILRRSR